MPASTGLGQQATTTLMALGTASPPTIPGCPTGPPLTGASGTTPGIPCLLDGFNGAQYVELVELNVGAATIRIQGSQDGVRWYTVGYQRADNQTVVTRAVADFALTQNTAAILQILDAYPLVRLNPITNAGSVFGRIYAVPG